MSSEASPVVKNLAEKLREFGDLRDQFKQAEAYAKAMEEPYRAKMTEIVDDMIESGMTSVNVVGHGTFTLKGTNYSRVVDMPSLLEWAIQADLLTEDVIIDENTGYVTITFKIDKKETTVEGTKVTAATLVNGQFSVDVAKAVLNELMNEYEGNVPGVVQFTTRYVTVYAKK